MGTLNTVARTFVDRVAFGSETLYQPPGLMPFNWYWYGQATREDGVFHVPPTRQRENPPDPFVPPEGAFSIGWSGGRGGPFPFCGSVADGTQFLGVTDCSGFLAYTVDATSTAAYEDFVAYSRALRASIQALQHLDRRHTQEWPSAADWAYAGYIPAPVPLPPSWMLVGNAATLQQQMGNVAPGDVLAWAVDDARSPDTGHVLIVEGVQPANDGTWMVSVLDASVIEHANDSRGHRGGIGSGDIFLRYADGWQVRFDIGDSWNPVDVLAALRLLFS